MAEGNKVSWDFKRITLSKHQDISEKQRAKN